MFNSYPSAGLYKREKKEKKFLTLNYIDDKATTN